MTALAVVAVAVLSIQLMLFHLVLLLQSALAAAVCIQHQ